MRKEANLLIHAAASVGVVASTIAGATKAEAQPQTEELQFKVVCVDPANDQNPDWADILQVRKAETSTDVLYEFTFNGPITNKKSIVRPDIGYGVALADQNKQIEEIFGARGAEKTADTKVAVENLAGPVAISQGPATPFKVESISWEGEGADFISSDGNVSTFSIPKDQISGLSGTEIYHTTEGTGHGNPKTQVHNKDICIPQPEVVPSPPKALVPPASKPPESTPTATEPPVVSFPPTGGEPLKNNGIDKTLLVSALGMASAAGAAFVSKLRSNKK